MVTDPRLSRRMFLKAGVVGVSSIPFGGSLLLPCGPARAGEAGDYVSLTTGRVMRGRPTTCGLCPAGCGVLAFADADGVPLGLAGNPRHPANRGALCAQGSAAMNLPGARHRVLAPLRRAGERGAGRWEPVGWDRALAELAAALERNARAGGGRGPLAVAVPERRMSPFVERFVSFFPGAILEVSDGYELGAQRDVHRAVWGVECQGVADLAGAEVVLNFGANPLGSVRQVVGAARAWADADGRGRARWFTLDPRLSETAVASRRWIPLRPGTDGAFASAVAAWILKSGREDPGFVTAWPDGEAERVRARVAPWTPERAAAVCGVPPGLVVEAAEAFAGADRAVAVFGSGVLARRDGARDARGILLLNVITGNVNRTGGYGFLEARPWEQPGPPPPSGAGGPVLPGTLFRELERGGLSVDTLISWDADPAATDPGGAGTVEVLGSPERVPFHVALASVWSETARLADLVLPAAVYFQEWGLCRGPMPAGSGSWVGLRQPVFGPPGQARPGEAVLLEGVRRVGPRGRAFFPFPDMGAYYRRAASVNLPGTGPESGLDALRRQGFVACGEPARWVAAARGTAAAPDAFPDGAEPADPAGVEPGGPGSTAEKGEGPEPAACRKTLLLYGSPLQGPGAWGLKWVEEIEHNRPLWMHPSVADEVGCAEGDWVKVRGPAGQIRTRVRFTEGLHPETVAMCSAGAGMSGEPVTEEEPTAREAGPPMKGDRVWWRREIYGENARKVVPWPPDPGPTPPGWVDTRVTVFKDGGPVPGGGAGRAGRRGGA